MTYEEMLLIYANDQAWDTIAYYAQSANDTTLKENAERYFASHILYLNDDIDDGLCFKIREKAILNIIEHTRKLPQIKIIVDGVAEDEKGAGGLWDLAADMLSIIEPSKVYTGDELQQHFYDKLRQFAEYTHPEHEENSGS